MYGISPGIVVSSTLLLPPFGPIITSVSPWYTSKFKSWITACSANPGCQPRLASSGRVSLTFLRSLLLVESVSVLLPNPQQKILQHPRVRAGALCSFLVSFSCHTVIRMPCPLRHAPVKRSSFLQCPKRGPQRRLHCLVLFSPQVPCGESVACTAAEPKESVIVDLPERSPRNPGSRMPKGGRAGLHSQSPTCPAPRFSSPWLFGCLRSRWSGPLVSLPGSA